MKKLRLPLDSWLIISKVIIAFLKWLYLSRELGFLKNKTLWLPENVNVKNLYYQPFGSERESYHKPKQCKINFI